MATATASAQAQNASSCALKGKEDLYGGFIIDPSSIPDDAVAFKTGLSASLQEWKSKYAGIWLKVPIERSAHIPLAVEHGFKFHHAEADHVMMTAWLPPRESTLPPNASHQVGVGAVVFNKQGELLVVREKHGPAGKLGVWKLPTGLVHAGEDLSDSVVREVLEETGLEVEFDCVLALRQAHGFAFGKSDMFFLCGVRLTAAASARTSGDGRPHIQPCLKEVEEARWMPLQEYCQSDFVRSRPMLVTLAKCMTAYAAGTYKGYKADKLSIQQGRPDLLIYGQEADSVMPLGWENC